MGYKKVRGERHLHIYLRYLSTGTPAFTSLIILSRPLRPNYLSYKSLCQIVGDVGVFLIFTKEGILTAQECLYKKLGGICLCYIR